MVYQRWNKDLQMWEDVEVDDKEYAHMVMDMAYAEAELEIYERIARIREENYKNIDKYD